MAEAETATHFAAVNGREEKLSSLSQIQILIIIQSQ